jgi:hypothetical protein
LFGSFIFELLALRRPLDTGAFSFIEAELGDISTG